jgi:hypothetical protein
MWQERAADVTEITPPVQSSKAFSPIAKIAVTAPQVHNSIAGLLDHGRRI